MTNNNNNSNSNSNSNRYVDTYMYVHSNSAIDPALLLLRLTIGYLVLLVLLLLPLTTLVRKLRKQRKIILASARKLQNDDHHGMMNRVISIVMAMVSSWTKMRRIVASVARRASTAARKISKRVIRPIRFSACACTSTPKSFGPRVVLMAGPGSASDACSDASVPSRFVGYNGAFAARRGNARRKNYNATRLAAFSVPLHEAGHGDQTLYRSYSDDETTTINDGSVEEDEMVGHGAYDDYEWRDLPDNIRNAATILGYCQTSWDEKQDVATSRKSWDELASNEMAAAVTLGYNETFWNKHKKSGHYDETLDANQLNSAIRGRDTLWAVLRFDKESREIVKVAFPTTMEAMVEAVLGALQLAAMSKYLGSDALAVSGVVNLAMILTEIFGAGIEAAEEVMVAQSIGSGDYYRAGSVVQLSVCLYMLLAIPVYSFWIYFIDDFALYFELGDDVARLAKAYVPVMSLYHVVQGGFSDTLGGLMRNSGKAWQMSIIDTLFSVFHVIGVVVGIVHFNCGLLEVAWIEVASSVIYGLFMYSFCACVGWLKPFQKGLFDMKGIQNDALIEEMVRGAIPLCIAEFLASGEWYILTVFAISTGDVAALTIAGAIWELFEQSSEGIGLAAVIRIGYHFGQSNPTRAKISAYKSLLACLFWSAALTTVFMWNSTSIVVLFTDDEYIKSKLEGTLVLIGTGNCAMCIGNLAWKIISAQSRPHIATWVYGGVGVVGICLPLASIFIYKLSYGIDGLVAAIIIGYGTVSAMLLVFIFTSNWTKICCRIISACSGVTFVAVDEEDGHRRWHLSANENPSKMVT